jgi:hypothetical protein
MVSTHMFHASRLLALVRKKVVSPWRNLSTSVGIALDGQLGIGAEEKAELESHLERGHS